MAHFGNDDGAVVFDAYGRSKSYYSLPLRNIFGQLPLTNEGKITSGLTSSVHRRKSKNRRHSAKERERREQQSAKDLAAHAKNVAASKQLKEEKAARAAKKAEDHRQMHISRSAAE